jgi:hypothetical protein
MAGFLFFGSMARQRRNELCGTSIVCIRRGPQGMRYEPGLNRSYLELADPYGAAILPARPYKPRDKAKVEQSVLIAERWILARLRNPRFFRLAELNAAIADLVHDINTRLMKGFNASRAELFAAIDRPALKEPPQEPYAFAVWKRCRVAPITMSRSTAIGIPRRSG